MSLWYALFAQLAMPGQVTSLTDEMDQSGTSDVTIIYAQILPVCAVEASESEVQLSLATTGDQPVGDVTYVCNSVDGFTRRVSSLNAGTLRRGAQGIDYYISQTGSGGLEMPRTRLVAPIVDEVPSSGPLTLGSSGILNVQIPAIARDLLAGQYRDTVTIEITPN